MVLDHLREKIRHELAETLGQEGVVAVSTVGPAGLLVGRFPCAPHGLRLYLLIPNTSDLRQNLDPGREVIVTSSSWQAQAIAVPDLGAEVPAGFALLGHPDRPWCVLAAVEVIRFEKFHPHGWGCIESYDLS